MTCRIPGCAIPTRKLVCEWHWERVPAKLACRHLGLISALATAPHDSARESLKRKIAGSSAACVQALREDPASKGITKKGFDFALSLIRMDPEDRDDVIQSLGLTMEANGLGKQEELDLGRPAAAGNGDDHCDRADAAGFRAASEGQFRNQNPEAPETKEFEAWDAGWLRQTSQHVASMGPGEGETAH